MVATLTSCEGFAGLWKLIIDGETGDIYLEDRLQSNVSMTLFLCVTQPHPLLNHFETRELYAPSAMTALVNADNPTLYDMHVYTFTAIEP